MKYKVKPKRQYDNSSRLARSADTKAAILDAARSLFSKRGVDTVTIDEIAEKAGVSSPTIYATFKSKAGVIKAIIENTFFGEHYAAVASLLQTTSDPVELLKITARISRVIFDNEKAEIGLMRGTSAFSPELRKIESEFEARRYTLQEGRANLLVQTYKKAATLGINKVRDMMWMLTGRDIYRMYVIERKWTSDEYEAWLASTMVALLVD